MDNFSKGIKRTEFCWNHFTGLSQSSSLPQGKPQHGGVRLYDLHVAIIALVYFIEVRDKLDTLADDEEDNNEDEDSGHTGFLNQSFFIIFIHRFNITLTFLEACRLLG